MKTMLLAAGAVARVHLAGESPDDDLLLEQQVSDRQWQVVCVAPCDRDLDRNGFYRVRGPGIPRSRAFQLASDAAGNVDLHVHPGWKLGAAGGVVLLAAGAASMALGGLGLLYAMSSPRQDLGFPALFVAGGALGVWGGASLLSTYARTRVEQPVVPAVMTPRPTWMIPVIATAW